MNFKRKFFLVLVSVLVILGLAACNNADVVKVAFGHENYTVKAGTTIKLDINITAGSNYNAATIESQLKYTVVDESVAKIVDGKLTGVGKGETEIKVEWSEKAIVFDRAWVVCLQSELPGVEFTEYSPNMFKGATQTISYVFDTTYTDATVRWESQNPEVATVDQNGVVTAVKAGTADIVCFSTDGVSEKPHTLTITVEETDFAINYVLNGGTNSVDNPAGFNMNDSVTFAEPTKAGYTFDGWYADEAFTTPATGVAAGTREDVTVYAKWNVVEYNITYNLEGGTATNPATYTVEDEITLAAAVKDGNEFLGWFDAEGNKVTKIEKGTTGDLELTAMYKAALFNINYELNGGHFVLPYVYQNHAEMVADFVKDFNAYSGKTVTIGSKDGKVTTDFFARSWMADGSSKGYLFLTSAEYGTKWAWMLDIINANRVARGAAELSAGDGQAEARGDVHNFLGQCDGTGEGANASFGGDYTNCTFESYCANLPKVPGVLEVPTTFNPNEGAKVPNPVKAENQFYGWGKTLFTLNTNCNTNFWGNYADHVFLYKVGDTMNATFSYRVALVDNGDGSYTVGSIANSGEAAFNRPEGTQYCIVLSESNTGYWGSEYSKLRETVKVGMKAIVSADENGVGTVKFVETYAKEPAASIQGTANSGYWTTYASDVFLSEASAMTNATFSWRVAICKAEDGSLYVGAVSQSGESFAKPENAAYGIVVSESHASFWGSELSKVRDAVKVGLSVKFDGDPSTGKAKVNFYNNYQLFGKDVQEDLNLEAFFVNLKDENAITYVLGDGVTNAENAPAEYLTSKGLVLDFAATKTGYTFKGWSLTEGGDVVAEIAKGTRGDIKLYPVFEATEYTLEYELNGGTFKVETIVNKYETFEELVADFLADYAAKFALTNLTAANFNTKTANYGFKTFMADTAMAEKWGWMETFMLNYSENYAGLTYMKNPSSTSNYNKYWRANVAAFLNQTKLSSPLTMDFEGCVTEEFWTENGLKKTTIVEVTPADKYTIEDLPLTLVVPMRDGHEFVGWCDNEYLKREFTALPAGTLGNIKLYAKWDDSVEGSEMKDIIYNLNGAELGANSPAQFEVGQGATLVDPVKPGYTFLGWTTTETGTEYITEIPATEREAVTVYAQWSIDTYSIEYSLPEGAYFYKQTTTTAINLYSGRYSANKENALLINKYDSMYALGGIPVYEGVLLMTPTAKWPSGLAGSKKIGLKDLGDGIYKVTKIDEGTVGGSGFLANNEDVDMCITAFNGCDYNAVLQAWNVAEGDLVCFSTKLDELTKGTAVELYAYTVTEAPSLLINKYDSMYALGGIPVYEGVLLMTPTAKWPSGLAGSKKIGLKDLGNGTYKITKIDEGTVGGSGFLANNEDVDMCITAFNGCDYNAVLQAWNVAEGDLVKFDLDLSELTKGTAVELTAYTVTEAPSLLINKYDSMYALGGIPVYEGVLLMTPTAKWPSGLAGSKKIGLKDLGNGTYKITKIDNGTVGGSGFLANNEDVDMCITAFNGCDYNAVLQAWDVAEGDLVCFSTKLDELTKGTAVELLAYRITEDQVGTTTITVDIDAPNKYTVEDLPLTLPTPEVGVEGKVFVGWYTDEKFFSERLLELPLGTLGNIKLYGRIENEGWVEAVHSQVNWELDGGSLDEAQMVPQYDEGIGFELPTPEKEGYTFLGWLLNNPASTDFITAVGTDVKGDITLYAVWYQKPSGPVDTNVYVGPEKEYKTLDEAVKAAEDGAVIVVDAGEYTLSVVLSKDVTIEGAGQDETIINVTKDVGGNIAAAVRFAHLTLKGAGGGAGVPGVTFQAAPTTKSLECEDVHITQTNTFVKFQQAAGGDIEINIKDCTIDNIGQFFIWCTAGIKTINFTGNKVDAGTCGAIANTAAALIRMRSGNAYVYDNYFKGTTQAIDGLFENGTTDGEFLVEYNTFANVGLYVHNNGGHPVIFNNNLYLDATGAALSAAPAKVANTGVTVDTNVFASEEERADAYAFKVNSVGKIVVGAGQQYESLGDAIAAAEAGATLYVLAGEYTLNAVLSKDITIEGVGQDKTIINVTKDVAGNINAYVKFAHLTLKGAGGGAGVPGVTFQANSGTKALVCEDVHITQTNTFIKFQNAANGDILISIKNCNIDNIGQFFIWCTAGIEKIEFEGNYVDAKTCGAIANTAASLIRMRSGNAYVYNNYFVGTTQAIDGLFENGTTDGEFIVKYNTFDNVGLYVHNNGGHPVIFDQNLYLDAAGAPLATVPAKVANTGVTVDTTVCKDDDARLAAYAEFVKGQQAQPEVVSKISYELNGATIVGDMVFVYTQGKKTALPGATLPNKKFLGWSLSATGADPFTEIAKDMTGDLKLYAVFRWDGLTVGEGQDYATLTDALAKAKAGDTIYVAAGTYAEEVEVKVANLTIRGVNNFGVKGYETRADEAEFTKVWTISAAGVTVDGLKFTGEGSIKVGADNFTVTNTYMYADSITAPGCNRKGMIVNAAAISNLTVKDSYLRCTDGTAQIGAIATGSAVCSNITIDNNVIDTDNMNTSAGNEAFALYNVGGFLYITNNKESFSTDYWAFRVGDTDNTCSIIVVKDNVFGGTTPDLLTCGFSIKNLKASSETNIIHNTFNYTAGTVLSFGSSQAKAVVNIKYNTFDAKTNYKAAYGSATVNFENNLYLAAQSTATSDVGVIADATALEAAYAKYLEAESSKTYGNIEYELNGGKLAISPKPTYTIGEELVLPTPTKSGYTFLGWSLTPDFAELITTLPATTTGDVKLYARFVQYGKLTLNANEGSLAENPTQYIKGEVNALPTPTREGYKFMGWYDNADFYGEAYANIPADMVEDLVLYALWQKDGKYNVKYVLNGANTLFANREQLVNELVKDFSANVKKIDAASNFFNISYGSTVTQINDWWDGTQKDKWGWLKAYFEELLKTNQPADFASDVAQIRGNIHNFLNMNGSSVYGLDMTTFAMNNSFWDTIQTEVEVKDATEILKAYYPYHTFLGWYDNAEFTGSPVRSLEKDCTLYAKWEVTKYQVNYVLGNTDPEISMADGLTKEFTAADSFDFPNPVYNNKHWSFDGWYYDAKFTLPATSVAECTDHDVTIYAKWTQILGFAINYNTNGGSLQYKDLDAVKMDFIKDYNEAMGTTYGTYLDVETGAWSHIDYHTFYEKVLEDGTNIRAKWLWLAKYLLALSERDLAGSNCNVLGLRALINQSGYSGDMIYGISYAFRAFLAETTVRPGGSYSSVDFSIYENQHNFWPYLAAAENTKLLNYQNGDALAEAYLENYKFEGWYYTPDFTGDKATAADENKTDANNEYTLYAKFVEANPVTAIEVTNKITEIKKFEIHQLEWKVVPEDAMIKTVKFTSSNPKVATVNAQGQIEALSEGKTTITITSLSSSGVSVSFELEVYSPDHFEISYATESYTEVNGVLQLNADYIKRDGTKPEIVWTSEDTTKATVDATGKVTTLNAGFVKITAALKDNGSYSVDFYITILSGQESDVIKFLVENNNSNVFTRYNLGIGAGKPEYYRDIISSISNIQFNDDLVIDRQYEAAQAGQTENHGGKKSSTEFITVHYTGNMAATSTAAANASYFSNGGGGTSIHYVIGNDGCFHSLDDSLIGYHAGDGTAVTFSWTATGVKVPTTGDVTPVWSISANSKYMINGQETTITIPAREDGMKITGPTFVYNGVEQNCINDIGLGWKIVGDEYYMGTTWWCTSQVAAGRLCSKGGNLNSIGIESAVNPESDLWYTWTKLAQLCAKLMLENNLGIERVVPHHFFSAKDCHQPFLANNCEIWYIFLDMVRAEYALLTTYKTSNVAMKIVAGADVTTDTMKELKFNVYNRDFTQKFAPGRVIPNEEAQVIVYELTVTTGETVETIKLASLTNSIYSEGASSNPSTYYMGHFVK